MGPTRDSGHWRTGSDHRLSRAPGCRGREGGMESQGLPGRCASLGGVPTALRKWWGGTPAPPSSLPQARCWSPSWMPDGKGVLRMDPGHRATERGGHRPTRNTQNDLYGKEQLRPKPPLMQSSLRQRQSRYSRESKGCVV